MRGGRALLHLEDEGVPNNWRKEDICREVEAFLRRRGLPAENICSSDQDREKLWEEYFAEFLAS